MNQWPGRRRTAKHLKGQMPMLLGPRVLHYPPVLNQEGCPCPRYRTFLITPLSSSRKGVLVRCLDSHEVLSSSSSLFFNEVTSSAIVFYEFLSSDPLFFNEVTSSSIVFYEVLSSDPLFFNEVTSSIPPVIPC
jgi:hypothetical protein